MSDKYNFNLDISTRFYTVEIDTEAQYGYFEHVTLGDERGGGIWLEGNAITDFDGTFELPLEVEEALTFAGFDTRFLWEYEHANIAERVAYLQLKRYANYKRIERNATKRINDEKIV